MCLVSDLRTFIETDLELKLRKKAIDRWVKIVEVQIKIKKCEDKLAEM